MYAQLGDIVFEGLYGLEQFNLKSEQVISEHPLIDGKPRLQNSGSKNDEVTISYKLRSEFTNPEKELDQIKQYKESSEVLTFINGQGVLIGDFVIKSYEYAIETTTPKGEIVTALVNLTLLENYYSDRRASDELAAKNNGFANANNSPIQTLQPIQYQSESGLVMKDITSINTGAGDVTDKLSTARKLQEDANRLMDGANSKLDTIRNTINGLESKLLSSLTLGQSAQQLLNQIPALLASISNLQIPLTAHDLQTALGLNTSFLTQISQMNINAAPLAGFVATKG